MSIWGPKIVTNGLVLCLDAANPKSYGGSGTAWTDLTRNNINSLLTAGAVYSSANNGILTLTNATITTYDASILDFGTNPFTVNMWIYINANNITVNNELGIINKCTTYQNSVGWGTEIASWGNPPPQTLWNVSFYITSQTTWGNAHCYSNAFPVYTWVNICFVRNGTTITGYKNGIAGTPRTHADCGLNVTNAVNIIFCKHSWGGLYAPIKLSNVQLYNRALSQTEITQNFDAIRGRFGV